jgi:hypothetical protein
MKIILKTLKGDLTEMEVEETKTVNKLYRFFI